MDSSMLHRLYLFSSESLRPKEWDLDSTMLHYLAVWKSMVSIHRPVHLKLHTLPDKLIAVYPWKMALKALLTTRWPFPRLCWNLFCAYCSKKLPESALTKKTWQCVLSITQLCVWAHQRFTYAQSTLSLPYTSLYDKIFQALYHFSVLQGEETCVGPGNEAPFWEEKSSAIETVYYLSHACTMQKTLCAAVCVQQLCERCHLR